MRAVGAHHLQHRGRRSAGLGHKGAVVNAGQQFKPRDGQPGDRHGGDGEDADRRGAGAGADPLHPARLAVLQPDQGPRLRGQSGMMVEKQAKGRGGDGGHHQGGQGGGDDRRRQRTQQGALLTLEQQQRRQDDDHRAGGVDHRRPHLQRGLEHDLKVRLVSVLGVGEPGHDVLDADHRVVDHHPQAHGQPAQCHGVERPAQAPQGDHRRQQRQGYAD